MRLEPPPHLAFGLAGSSPPDRFYTFASPTLGGRASALVLARSLARSLAARYVDSTHGQFHHGREDRSFFSSSPDIRAYADASPLHVARCQWSRGCCVRTDALLGLPGARTNGEGREKGPSARVNLRFADIPRIDHSNRSIDRSRFCLPPGHFRHRGSGISLLANADEKRRARLISISDHGFNEYSRRSRAALLFFSPTRYSAC